MMSGLDVVLLKIVHAFKIDLFKLLVSLTCCKQNKIESVTTKLHIFFTMFKFFKISFTEFIKLYGNRFPIVKHA